MLETERGYIESHRDELLRQYGGKFLLIKGETVTGSFDSMDGALEGAVLLHGLDDVLIRRPLDTQMEVSVPALTLGILGADFSWAGGRDKERA